MNSWDVAGSRELQKTKKHVFLCEPNAHILCLVSLLVAQVPLPASDCRHLINGLQLLLQPFHGCCWLLSSRYTVESGIKYQKGMNKCEVCPEKE